MNSTTAGEPHHSIKMAARRAGLSPHVIRVWEKRYGAVQPNRTGTNRRLFSEAEIERLHLLRLVTHLGHNISTVARLPVETLRTLAAEPSGIMPVGRGAPVHRSPSLAELGMQFVEDCLARIRQLDAHGLDETLSRSVLAFGVQGMLQHVAGPLAQRIGDLWREGSVTAGQEHFASARIRGFLVGVSKPYPSSLPLPAIAIATPVGQLHELGAAIVAAAASNSGWRVTYLGASLPAEEIAGASVQNRARAVALSIVFPDNDPGLPDELEKLRRNLPADVRILAGGRAASAYQEALRNVGAIIPPDLPALLALLDEWRRPAS
jgi:MerR family transcriptional regulator, light-induced transcriptional regulator